MDSKSDSYYFILVHGTCHGAWCWHKLAALLGAAGHRVAAVDLAGCGIDPRRPEDFDTLHEYSQPLLDVVAALPPGERAILVGHSYGGLSVAVAAERFPEKVSAAVFALAFMPSFGMSISEPFKEYMRWCPMEIFMDSDIKIGEDPEHDSIAVCFGPKFLAEKCYQLCSSEDLCLAKMLVRPSKWPKTGEIRMTKERYGSVSRVYITSKKDLAIPVGFQRWMIEKNMPLEVMEMEDVDHMLMLSKPKELCGHLLEIARKYN